MKDLKSHLQESLGFTIDDELAAEYIAAFKEGDFGTFGESLRDIDIWDSLGTQLQQYVMRESHFTGILDRHGSYPEIAIVKRNNDLKGLLTWLGDRVSNIFDCGKPDQDTDFYTLCYKGQKPVQLDEVDPEDPSTWESWINPRANWRNMVKQEHLEWIINILGDEVWYRNHTSLKSLVEYTGWEIYEGGKRVA